MDHEKERQAAIEAVIKAARLCQDVWLNFSPEDAVRKEDSSPVTVADFGAQALIVDHLLRLFPDDLIVGEESAGILRQTQNLRLKEELIHLVRGHNLDVTENLLLEMIDLCSEKADLKNRFWALDPIDGTKGFMRGDQYAVALALIEDGKVVLGVMGCPNLPLNGLKNAGSKGSLFAAVRGGGSVMMDFNKNNKTPIAVADVADPSPAQLCESVESDHSSHEDNARVAQYLGIICPPFRMDSQCKYGVVARGDASVYLRIPSGKSYTEKIWDHASGCIIVEEAGGRVTDLEGRPLDFTAGRDLTGNRGLIASNNLLHDQILQSIKKLGI